jgi:hypothetical protein
MISGVERVVPNSLVNAALPRDFRRTARKKAYWLPAMDIVFGETDPRVGAPFLSCEDI